MAGSVLVSVIIPTLNAGKVLSRLLDSVVAQRIPGGLQVIVIDSGSRDGTPDRARSAGAQVLSIPRRSFDHGQARNRAIAASSGEFVALTVQDAMPCADEWLCRLLEPLLTQPDVAGSYGLQLAPQSAGLLARARSSLWSDAHAGSGPQSIAGPEEWASLTPEDRLGRIRFDNVTSCIRRSVWQEFPLPAGGFGEDMRWARQVLLAGHKLLPVPSAQVWHSHERGWYYDLRRAYGDGQNRVRLAGWPSAGLGPGDATAVLRRLVFFALSRRFDSVRDPAAVREFVKDERRRYEPLAARRPVQVYLEALRFGLTLTERASGLEPDGLFSKGEWIGLLRFALAVSAGRALGTTAATAGDELPPGERAFWRAVDRLLGRTV